MKIDIMTLFPQMCESVIDESIIGRARKAGFIEVNTHNIRDFSDDKHRRVDDTPYGGGKGMLMQVEPIFKCFEAIEKIGKPHVIYMSPQGKVLTQEMAVEYSKMEHIILLCGHYEGVDERVLEEIVDEEVSIGDYVLTGGELPALVFVDTVARMCDGVLDSEECFKEESHFSGLLEYPQYTRPNIWHGKEVPEVLLSGHHGKIDAWRFEKSLERTYQKRPDMYKRYYENIDDDTKKKLKKLKINRFDLP